MDCIGSICFLMQVKKNVIQSLVYVFFCLLCTNVNAATSSVSFFHGQLHNNPVVAENMLKVDIFYYRDFPYSQRYAHQEIKDCIKIPARGIVRCKEFISLVRSESQVNDWLHSQYEKGYLPLTMKSFGVTNTRGHINKAAPAGFLSVNKKMDNLKTPYVPATGIFIRHAIDVRQYTFKNLKTNMVFSVKATPEHPVYSASRHVFVPVSQLFPEDILLAANGEKIQLLCRHGINQGIKNGCSVPVNKGGITRVYNIEVSQRHTYFVQSEKLLVHNHCDAGISGRDTHKIEEKTGLSTVEVREQPVSDDGEWVRVVALHTDEKACVHGNKMTLEQARLIKSQAGANAYQCMFEKCPGLNQFINTRKVGIMDGQGFVARYSDLEKLSFEKGVLTNGSLPVKERLDDFGIGEELRIQHEASSAYRTQQGANRTYKGVTLSGDAILAIAIGASVAIMIPPAGVEFYMADKYGYVPDPDW